MASDVGGHVRSFLSSRPICRQVGALVGPQGLAMHHPKTVRAQLAQWPHRAASSCTSAGGHPSGRQVADITQTCCYRCRVRTTLKCDLCGIPICAMHSREFAWLDGQPESRVCVPRNESDCLGRRTLRVGIWPLGRLIRLGWRGWRRGSSAIGVEAHI